MKNKMMTAQKVEKIMKTAYCAVIAVNLGDESKKNTYQMGNLYIKADDKDLKDAIKYCKKYKIKIPAELIMPSNILYIGEI